MFGSLQPISIFTDLLKKKNKKKQACQLNRKRLLNTLFYTLTSKKIEFKPSELYMHRNTTTFLHELIKKPQGNINHMLS